MSFSNKAINYFNALSAPKISDNSINIINPYESPEVKKSVKNFYTKFYDDNKDRTFIIGINPGRFGGGLTGISFTDPVVLRTHCKIENDFGNRAELSSKFIYAVIENFGGVKKFFSRFFLTALYPFALIKDGKNYNYYDSTTLADKLRSSIIKNIKEQITFGARRERVIILGKKNAAFFSALNDKHKIFKEIVVLEHPRFIMQYRIKNLKHYIDKYIKAVNN